MRIHWTITTPAMHGAGVPHWSSVSSTPTHVLNSVQSIFVLEVTPEMGDRIVLEGDGSATEVVARRRLILRNASVKPAFTR